MHHDIVCKVLKPHEGFAKQDELMAFDRTSQRPRVLNALPTKLRVMCCDMMCKDLDLQENEPPDVEATRKAFSELAKEINAHRMSQEIGGKPL